MGARGGWSGATDPKQKYLALIPRVGGAVVDDNFMNPPELSEILGLPEHVLIGQPRREADDENEIPLDDPNVGQVFPVLGNLLLLGLK